MRPPGDHTHKKTAQKQTLVASARNVPVTLRPTQLTSRSSEAAQALSRSAQVLQKLSAKQSATPLGRMLRQHAPSLCTELHSSFTQRQLVPSRPNVISALAARAHLASSSMKYSSSSRCVFLSCHWRRPPDIVGFGFRFHVVESAVFPCRSPPPVCIPSLLLLLLLPPPPPPPPPPPLATFTDATGLHRIVPSDRVIPREFHQRASCLAVCLSFALPCYTSFFPSRPTSLPELAAYSPAHASTLSWIGARFAAPRAADSAAICA